MAITVTCQCGKTLKAKDESAGKRAKCPGCGAILTIQADADTFDLAPETIPTAQTAAPAAPLAAPGAPEVPQEPAIAAGPIPSPTPTPAPARPPQAAAFPTRRQLAARGDNPRLTLSPRVIMLIVAAILIPTVMWLVRIGPMRAQAMWKEKAKIGQDPARCIKLPLPAIDQHKVRPGAEF